jgi:hypothetical protein
MKLSCNAGISIGDFRPVTANHHRQTAAFVYEREKIFQFFTRYAKCHEAPSLSAGLPMSPYRIASASDGFLTMVSIASENIPR